MKDEVNSILAEHYLCVMSTVAQDSLPEAAIVGYSHGENLELLIGTSCKSRKYKNLMENPHVAIVIGDETAEVQYEGAARELGGDELQHHLKTHFAKLPGTTKYLNNPNQRWLLVTPTWLRLLVHGDEDKIEEMSKF